MKKYVCVDIGGTAIKYGVIESDGQILCRDVTDTDAQNGGPAILNKVRDIVENFCAREKISGICISTAGIVDTVKGEITYSAPLIPDYTGIGYKRALEGRFGIPCEVENDVNCAGLAEFYTGASAGSQISLMLTVGTGIGGSLVMNGEVYRGFSGSACEVGYLSMGDSDFQTLGAASILTKKVAERKNEPQKDWDGYRIFEAAKGGDVICLNAIDEMTEVLGLGIANICYVINPQVVVLGGGIMAQKEFLKERIERAVSKHLMPEIFCNTKLAFAKHGNDAGMLGAFYHFRQRHRVE